MRLTFLGTAAAERFPAPWCRCPSCMVARQRGGRDLRACSALLVNDDLLIAAGPDLATAAARLGMDLAAVQAVLVTHPHDDHLDRRTFLSRALWACGTPLPVLELYASQAALAMILAAAQQRPLTLEALRIRPHPIRVFQQFEIATGGTSHSDPRFPPPAQHLSPLVRRCYRVWTLAARHARPEDEACLFVIQQLAGPEVAGRDLLPTLFYGTDTGPFPPDTWAALDRLKRHGIRLSAAILDATLGTARDGEGHMNVRQMAAHHQALTDRGLLAPTAQRLAHHFSHYFTPPHNELAALLAPTALRPAYDGLMLHV